MNENLYNRRAQGPLKDVMVDAETLGTVPGSAILSIGAVMFGPAGLGEEFYAPISLASCTAAGLTIDPGTLAWWMKQSDAARAAAFRDDAEPLAAVLEQFTSWFNLVEAERPWAQGANFDPPLLEAAYRACGMTPPWKFWNVRDTRTLYEQANVRVDRTRGTHHNALDDARAQAEAAVIAVQRLQDAEQTQAARDVLAERRRQIDAEGMTSEGDDRYHAAELPRAAAAYVLNGANDDAPSIWPWAKAWWKPRDARANYVRAAALLLAEIERIDRAAIAAGHIGGDA